MISVPLVDNNYDNEVIIEKYAYQNDAYLNSSFFSHLTFYWAFKIIKLANITKLKNEYLGSLELGNKSYLISKDLEKVWHSKNYKSKKTCPLFLALLRANISNRNII